MYLFDNWIYSEIGCKNFIVNGSKPSDKTFDEAVPLLVALFGRISLAP
jgi:hypothetical protein